MPAGAFARGDLPDVPGAELVVGLFADSLPGFLEDHPGHIDLPARRRRSLQLRQDRRSTCAGHGCARAASGDFDEFFNFPGWQRHEYRAWTEYVERTGVEFEYVAYTYSDNQVTVKITKP